MGTIRRSVVLVVVAALASSGCYRSKAARNTALVAGAVIAAAGVAVLVEGRPDEADNVVTATVEASKCMVLCTIGVGLISAGGVLFLTGAASRVDESPPAPLVVSAAPAPAPSIAELRVPAAVERPLPEVATDALTLQLAKQVRGAAMSGRCETVDLVLEKIEGRDPSYHLALVASNVIDGCR
jgi:hypothetical protein